MKRKITTHRETALGRSMAQAKLMRGHEDMLNGRSTVMLSAAAFVMALLAGIMITAQPANAQDCKWYATNAMKQQQFNEAKKCGFSGDKWHSDFGAHIAWCSSVSPDEWKARGVERKNMLEGCKK